MGITITLHGDGGIDGIIMEDRLGLDTIFIQARRWQGSVGRPEIQKFVGALQRQRAKKGVFIPTSFCTVDATDYATRIDTKVVLIECWFSECIRVMEDKVLGEDDCQGYDSLESPDQFASGANASDSLHRKETKNE